MFPVIIYCYYTFLDGKLGDIEKRACQVLCQVRDEGDEAKEVMELV